MRNRFLVLRKKIKKDKSCRAYNKIFHLNIFEGEFDDAQEPAVFDERHDSNPLVRDLQDTVSTLHRSLQESRQELTQKEGELTNKELTVAQLHAQVEDLSETNTFLSHHVDALEKETAEQHRKIIIDNNKTITPPLSNAPATSKRAKKVLGTKKFSELGEDAKNKTRAAYRVKAEELNEFGANRELVVKEIILRDENGKKVPINIQKPHTFPNLTAEEKSEVETASAWKDLNRLSDKAYSSMTKIGSIPPASHVKQYEAEVNAQLEPILPVSKLE